MSQPHRKDQVEANRYARGGADQHRHGQPRNSCFCEDDGHVVHVEQRKAINGEINDLHRNEQNTCPGRRQCEFALEDFFVVSCRFYGDGSRRDRQGRLGRLGRLDVNRTDEPVSLLRNGLDEAWFQRIVVQRFAYFLHGDVDRVLELDELSVGPKRFLNIRASDQRSRATCQ